MNDWLEYRRLNYCVQGRAQISIKHSLGLYNNSAFETLVVLCHYRFSLNPIYLLFIITIFPPKSIAFSDSPWKRWVLLLRCNCGLGSESIYEEPGVLWSLYEKDLVSLCSGWSGKQPLWYDLLWNPVMKPSNNFHTTCALRFSILLLDVDCSLYYLG